MKPLNDKSVKLMKVSEESSDLCLTLDKRALLAIKEGKSIPIDLVSGEKKFKLLVMRDSTFSALVQKFAKLKKKDVDVKESQT